MCLYPPGLVPSMTPSSDIIIPFQIYQNKGIISSSPATAMFAASTVDSNHWFGTLIRQQTVIVIGELIPLLRHLGNT